MAKFYAGQLVKVGRDGSIPLRYHGRTGSVIGTKRVGRSTQFAVDMHPNRVAPLYVIAKYLTAV